MSLSTVGCTYAQLCPVSGRGGTCGAIDDERSLSRCAGEDLVIPAFRARVVLASGI
jgi:hypothetical protein